MSPNTLAVLLALATPTAGFGASQSRPLIGATATRRASAAPVSALPPISAVAAACVAPTCLGFWRSGYAVSYAYGGAMAAGGWLMLPREGLAAWHAAAYLAYGLRLCAFLAYRQLALPASVHQMVARAASPSERLRRAPVVLGCALLYYCMLAPLRVTASVGAAASAPAAAAVGVMWAGLAVAALGDAVKSAVKAREGYGYAALASNHLVRAFPFSLLRHPNYTGEFVGWGASFAAAVLSAVSASAVRAHLAWLVTSAIGTVGIMFVLMEAAGGLEKKQRAKYAGRAEYEEWIKGSWAGPVLAKAE
jgi:steroid 5-alpha reductase family enzyme